MTKYTGDGATVLIPDEVGDFKVSALSNPNIMRFEVSDSNERLSVVDGVLFSKDRRYISKYPAGRKGSYAIPNGVREIYGDAFHLCDGLTEVHIPDSLIEVYRNYFKTCKNIEAVHVLETNEGLSSAGGVLYDKKKAKLLIFPRGRSDKSFDIPSGVEEIGTGAFGNCTNLTAVSLPEGAFRISAGAFAECKNLATVSLPDSMLEIACTAFAGCEKLEELVLPRGIKEIGGSAFRNCTSLARIKWPDKLKDIQKNTFSGCTSLASIEIPKCLSIEEGAFNGCTSLATAIILNSKTFVGEGAFDGCPNLTIISKKGSHVEKYAIENGIPFKELNTDLTDEHV